jgi:hypothetical protein
MAGDDRTLFGDEDRIGPTPFPQGCGDLIDLLAALGPRVASIRD